MCSNETAGGVLFQGQYWSSGVLFSRQDTFIGAVGGGMFQGHYWSSGVLFSHQDMFPLGLLVVGCPSPLLGYVCFVPTPGNAFALGCCGALLKDVTGVCVCCSHTKPCFVV